MASKGCLPKELIHMDVWWKGPKIQEDEESCDRQQYLPDEELPERKKQVTLIALNKTDFPFSNYSNLAKLKRIITYCLRFKTNIKRGENKITGSLTLYEINEGLNTLIKIAQMDSFGEEMKQLQNKIQIQKKAGF